MDLSEVKNFPKVDHTPAELDEASKLLLKAAALIEQCGLAKWATCDDRGAMCVRGALLVASGVPRIPDVPAWGWHSYIAEEADRRLGKALGSAPPDWNNAPDRTQAEVVAKLRAVALGHC